MGAKGNPAELQEFFDIIDEENGIGYSANISDKGYFVRLANSNAKVFYEVKNLNGGARVIFINYIHYNNKKEMLSLLAFCCQWWHNLKPTMVYLREKNRPRSAGKYLKSMGFNCVELENNLKPFNCNIDGSPCQCPVYEYTAFNQGS